MEISKRLEEQGWNRYRNHYDEGKTQKENRGKIGARLGLEKTNKNFKIWKKVSQHKKNGTIKDFCLVLYSIKDE